MLRRLVPVSLFAATVALATVPLLAAPQATLILVSGERVRGELVDMGAQFTMLVGGAERRIAIPDVAVIDFVGGGNGIPATETSQIRPGQALIIMRGGRAWYGNLVDISGDNPLRMMFQNQDGNLEVSSNEIGRIFLRKWEGMPEAQARPTPAPAPAPAPRGAAEEGISVPANAVWVDTGIQVRSGQMVVFAATGEVGLSAEPGDTAGPAGAYSGREAYRGAPMPGVAAGALVGKVGNGPVFAIGNQTQALRMPSAGVLFLAVNDDRSGDNRGEFRVKITVR